MVEYGGEYVCRTGFCNVSRFFFFFFLLRVEKYGGICRVRYGR